MGDSLLGDSKDVLARWELIVSLVESNCNSRVAADGRAVYLLLVAETCGLENRLDNLFGSDHKTGTCVNDSVEWLLDSSVVDCLSVYLETSESDPPVVFVGKSVVGEFPSVELGVHASEDKFRSLFVWLLRKVERERVVRYKVLLEGKVEYCR